MRLLAKYHLLIALSSLSVIGGAALVVGTRWGIGLSPDSAFYIGAARNLLSGNGFGGPSYSGEWIPAVHYPPLFPTLLAGIGIFGMDPIEGARWLNAVLFGSNIVLIGLCLYALIRSFFLSVAASFLMLISFPMVLVHSMAWSEPLLIFFGILGIYFLALYIEKANGLILLASSVAVGLAFLARYIGISLVATGVAATLLLTREGWRKRLIHTGIFCSISCAPMGLWVARNLAIAGTATGRKTAFHPLNLGHLESLLETVSTWLFPVSDSPLGGWLSIPVLILLGFIALIATRQGQQDKRPDGIGRLPALLGFFTMSYGLLLAFSISFLDAQTPLDNRILSPVYVAAAFLFLCLLHILLSRPKTKGTRILSLFAGAVLVLLSISQLGQSASWLERSYKHGVGYASREWNQSQLMKYVRTLDPNVPIFSNGPDIVHLLTGRPAYMIPRRIDPGTILPNDSYGDELAAMRNELQEKKGVVVYFYKISWRWYLASESETREKLNLNPIVRTEDGAVYR